MVQGATGEHKEKPGFGSEGAGRRGSIRTSQVSIRKSPVRIRKSPVRIRAETVSIKKVGSIRGETHSIKKKPCPLGTATSNSSENQPPFSALTAVVKRSAHYSKGACLTFQFQAGGRDFS